MRRIIAIAVGVWCAVFFVKPLMAQVNIERLRPSLGPGVMSQSLRFGVTYLTGNSDSLEIQPVYRLDYSESGWSAFVMGDVHYGNRNGINFVNQTFFHGRIMVPVTDYATLEVFVQKERDDFRRMRDRQLFGGNYRLALLNSPYLQVAAALGVMLENENNTIEGESCLFRLNSYGTGHFSLANFNGTVSCGGVEGERAWNFVIFSLSFLICFSFVFFINRYRYSASMAVVRAADSALDSPNSGLCLLKTL